MIGDIDVLQEVAIQGTDQVVASLVSFLWVAGCILALNLKLGLVTILPILLVGVLVALFNVRVKTIYRAARDRLGDVGARLQENLAGMVVIKAFAKEEAEADRFRAATDGYLHESPRHQREDGLLPIRAVRRLHQQCARHRRRRVAGAARRVHGRRARGVPRILVAALRAGAAARHRERPVPARHRGRQPRLRAAGRGGEYAGRAGCQRAARHPRRGGLRGRELRLPGPPGAARHHPHRRAGRRWRSSVPAAQGRARC